MLRPAFAKYRAKELDGFDFAAFHEISRTEKNLRSTEKNLHSQSWDLNPGLLGEKLIHSLCAMPPPSYGNVKLKNVWLWTEQPEWLKQTGTKKFGLWVPGSTRGWWI